MQSKFFVYTAELQLGLIGRSSCLMFSLKAIFLALLVIQRQMA
jgi:hypothetical protein